MHKIIYILLGSCLFTNTLLNAQDPNFSQYFASPMTVNPALVGKGVADWRAIAQYRNQWYGNTGAMPYTTSAFSLEKRLKTANTSNDQLAIGLLLLNDASNGGLLKNNYISAGLAYNNALDREGNLLFGGGISINYHTRLLDQSKFVFQSQFGTGGYIPGVGLTDGVNIANNSYLDINAGLHISERKKTYGYTIGASYFHAANPKDGAYIKDQNEIFPRISFQGGIQFYSKNNSELDLSMITNHQKTINDLVTIGAQYKFHIPDEILTLRSFNIGVWQHFGMSTAVYAGLETRSQWLFGISYHFINSDISYGSNSMQSIECSFAWQFAGKKNKVALQNLKSVVMY